MENFLRQLRRIAWAVVEAAFLLIVLCLLLNIIIGDKADSFISSVAKNATAFLQSLPPGVFLGLVLIAVIWGFLRSRFFPPR
jgi:Na+-translocating ferredoxin:NAD+ oxidoreductase RnfE subunit